MQHVLLAVLKADPRDRFTPAELARIIGHPEGSVRKALRRLADRRSWSGHPLIVSKAGRYRAWVDGDTADLIEQPDYELHAIQASCTLPPNRGRGVRVAARQDSQFKWTENAVAESWVGRGHWEDRAVTVNLYQTGTVQVSLEASKRPLSFLEHEMFWAWVQGALQSEGILWVPEFATLDNLEANRDYKRVALSGGKGRRVMLRAWRNGWMQVYQKDVYRLRREFRWTKDTADVVTIQEAMSWGPPKPSQDPEWSWDWLEPQADQGVMYA